MYLQAHGTTQTGDYSSGFVLAQSGAILEVAISRQPESCDFFFTNGEMLEDIYYIVSFLPLSDFFTSGFQTPPDIWILAQPDTQPYETRHNQTRHQTQPDGNQKQPDRASRIAPDSFAPVWMINYISGFVSVQSGAFLAHLDSGSQTPPDQMQPDGKNPVKC